MEYCGSEGVQGRSRKGWRAGKVQGSRRQVVDLLAHDEDKDEDEARLSHDDDEDESHAG